MKRQLLIGMVICLMLFSLLNSTCLTIYAVEASSYEVNYDEIVDFENTFIGRITLKNTGEKELYKWKIEFDFDGTIERLCNAYIESHVENHYVLSSNKQKEILAKGKSLRILLKGTKNVDNEPSNIYVKELSDEIAAKAAKWNTYVQAKEAELMNISAAEFLYYRYTRFEADTLYADGYEHIVKNPVRDFTDARYQNIEFESEGGIKLKGLFFPVRKPKGTLIALHGRGDDMYNTIPHIEFLLENGYQVLLFNGRFWNYFENPENYYGTMMEDTYDVGSAVEYLKTRCDVDKNNIGVIGFSNGANKALIAGRHFTGIKTVISNGPSAFPVFDNDEEICPPGWLYIREDWMKLYCERYGCTIEDFKKTDALTCLSETKKPFLILHGSNDPYVKTAEILRLFDAANGPKEMYIFQNSAHCNEVLTSDKDEYVSKLINFLDTYMNSGEHNRPRFLR